MAVQSFEGWYGRHHARLLAALRVRCGDEGLASEALDEACSRALARWGRVGELEEPAGWVYRVALNRLRRTARRSQLEATLLRFRPERPAPQPGEALEVWDAVGRLPARQRDVVLLRYVVDLPEAAIAEALGISRGAVSATTAKARAALAAALGETQQEVLG